MLNESITITPLSANSVLLSWTAGNSDDVSQVFANGVLAASIFSPASAARSAVIDFAVGDAVALEIHDLPAGTAAGGALNFAANTLPALAWNYISSAVKYRVYHHKKGAAEKVIATVAARENETSYGIICPKILDGDQGVWHFFRVEAVDQYGNESTRAQWRYFAYEPPDPASNLQFAAGSGAGLYDITITV